MALCPHSLHRRCFAFQPRVARPWELPWVNRTTISYYPEGVMPIPNLFDLTDIGATLSGLKNKSAFLPRVARGASQPWAGRRNAFGIKNDLKCQKGPTVAEEVDMKCNIFDKVDVRSSAPGLSMFFLPFPWLKPGATRLRPSAELRTWA